MASVKVILRRERKQDGLYPLAIRITKNRKSSYVYLEYRIKETDWDENLCRVKKSHPNSTRLNNFILQKLAEATENSLDVEVRNADANIISIRNKVKQKATCTFFKVAENFLTNLRAAGKYNQYTSDKPRIQHFKEFLKKADIPFTDITVGLLEKFEVYLRAVHGKAQGKKVISDRTIANHFVVIRSVFAHARKNGLIYKNETPFGENGFKICFPDSKKIGITPEDVKAIEAIVLADLRHEHARKLWLFSFYFAGMRVSDILRLKWSNLQNNRLHYSMGKNDKVVSLKIPDKAAVILKYYEQYKEHDDDFVFPELKGVDLNDEFESKRKIQHKTSAIDKMLRLHVAPAAKISGSLTMHIARHTFGGIAGDAIPIQMLQKLYRHSNVSTTIGYQANFINKEADDALDAVISKV